MEINSWFECKVKMDVMQDDGITKPQSFIYLVDALNFTEAESRIIEEVKPYTSGNLDVTDIKRVKYAEIFPCDSEVADRWYKVRCLFITLDEKTQTEKEIANNMLVQAGPFVRRTMRDSACLPKATCRNSWPSSRFCLMTSNGTSSGIFRRTK